MRATHPNQINDLLLMALTAGDAAGAAALYEQDAVHASDADNPIQGRAAIQTMIEEFLLRKPAFTLHSSEVVHCGEVALVRSRWSLVWTEGDEPSMSTEVEPALVVRRQSDGYWLIAIDRPIETK